MTRRAAAPKLKGRSGPNASTSPAADDCGYLIESEQPWVSLVFVLPFALVYECYSMGWFGPQGSGHPNHGAGSMTIEQIRAFSLIDEAYRLFFSHVHHLPLVTLIAWLVIAQLRRGKGWGFHLSTLLGMAMESVFWSLPLIILGWALARFLPLARPETPTNLVILSLGAGVYEELLFRLIGVSFLAMVLRRFFDVKKRPATSIVLILSGVIFSLYHYLGYSEPFSWRTFIFRTVAGCYLTALFVLRGFGVTSGSHACYDISVAVLLSR